MSHSKGTAYEKLVHELVTAITRGTPLSEYAIGSGLSNRIPGASGYKHQIDLSLAGSGQLHLLELKCLHKSVGVCAMLVLAARFADISAARPDQKVFARIVSLKRPSRNVMPLARQFGIGVDIVEDLQSYGLSFASQHFVGHVERANAQAHQHAEIIRGSGG
jgi:hypothetical protein